MKLYLYLLGIFLAGATHGQIDHELRFDCLDYDKTKCNPFTISDPNCPDQGIYKNNWRVSHGSPQLNPTGMAVLKAVDSDSFSPKGEGLFLNYNFLANHNYTIEFILRVGNPDFLTTISISSKAANGLTAKTNASICSEETLPTVNDAQTILDEAPLPFESGNELGLITVSNFIPTKNFNYFWVYAAPVGFGTPTSNFIISHVTITDVTPDDGGGNNGEIGNNTICCEQTYPLSSSEDPKKIYGELPTGGNGTYTYQWYYQSTLSYFSQIAGATAQHYDPPVSTGTVFYMRSVTSGATTSNSNSIKIQVGTAADSGYPHNIKATNITGRKVIITWDQSSPGLHYHHSDLYLYSRRVGSIWAAGEGASFILDDLLPCNTYLFRITAVLSNNEDRFSPVYRGSDFTFTTAKDIAESYVLDQNYTNDVTRAYRGQNITFSDGFHFNAVSPAHSFFATSKPETCATTNSRSSEALDKTIYRGFDDTSPIITYKAYDNRETAISGYDSNKVTVYPNPSGGHITLNLSEAIGIGNKEIIIYDILGNEVYSENISSHNKVSNLDLAFLRTGIYYLKYCGEQFVVTHKIIIE